MIPNGKKKILNKIKNFVIIYKKKAKKNSYRKGDDVRCYKMIFAIAEMFPVDKNYQRTLPKEAEKYLKELWYLYFFFKHNIAGEKIKYSSIVNRYC